MTQGIHSVESAQGKSNHRQHFCPSYGDGTELLDFGEEVLD
jgi:hypothetical protein